MWCPHRRAIAKVVDESHQRRVALVSLAVPVVDAFQLHLRRQPHEALCDEVDVEEARGAHHLVRQKAAAHLHAQAWLHEVSEILPHLLAPACTSRRPDRGRQVEAESASGGALNA